LSRSDAIDSEATSGQTIRSEKIASHSRLPFERNAQKRKEKFEKKRKVPIAFYSLSLTDLTPSYK